MIPLVHDFRDETVLVFGGGSVGARKARRFAREARVLVVSPTFQGTQFGDATLVRAAPDEADVSDWLDRASPALVVAATDDPDVNGAIEAAARERGVLVNRADESGTRDAGSVVVPATVRDGPVVVAVSTGGRSPALSRHLRERIEPAVESAGEMARLTASVRETLQEQYAPDERRAAIRAVVRSDDVWKALDTPSANARQTASEVIADVTGETT
ncbi:MAG: precorrin-2 dehydrogenase/sirohydrochlorin ferrochelatase [Haloarculaceae archaeon]|jgi:precorrin-2 dehydrogenase/sirohydrochlorin ferrochelatase